MQKTLSRNKGFAVLLTLMLTLPLLSLAFITPARAASGSISVNPVKFTMVSGAAPSLETTTVVLNGGTFGSGKTVDIYISPDKTFDKTADAQIGTVTLEAGQTSFSNTVVALGGAGYPLKGGWTAGTYYIAATDDGGATWTSWVEVTLTLQNPEISLYDATGAQISSASPGSKVTVKGTGFTANTGVTVYLNRPGGQVLAKATTKSDGSFSVDFTVPNLAKSSSYKIIAQQADTLQDEESLSITSKITVEPFAVGTAAGQVITVKGYGFTKGAKILANTIGVTGATVTNPEVAVADDGTFTVTATITTTMTTGWKTVSVSSDGGDSATASLLVSAPGFTETSVSLLGGTSSADVKVKDSKTIYVWNYPASTVLTILMGGTELGTITTNSIGAGYLDVTIPELPGSASGVSYRVDAVNYDQGIVAVNTLTLTVKSSLYVKLQDTFATGTGVVANIYGYGAAPLDTLTISFANSRVTSNVTSVKTNAVGSFNVTVKLTAATGATTGQTDTAQATGSLTGTVQATPPVTIWRDDQASISLDKYCAVVGNTVTVSISDLRPSTSYEVFFGGASLPTKVTFTTTSTGGVSTSPTFTVPSVGQNPYEVSVVVAGTTIKDAYKYMVVSSPGTTPLFLARAPGKTPSSTITVSPGDKVELYVFGFSSGETIDIYRVGDSTVIQSQSGGTAGGYLYEWTVPDIPSGTYRLYAKGSVAGTIGQYVYLTVAPKFTTFTSTSGSIGATVSFSAKGLTANTAFNVIFGNIDLGYVGTSDISGNLPATGTLSFNVPTVVEGTYTVKLVPSSDPSKIILSKSFTVIAPSDLTVTPNPSAFPTQLITFKWTVPGLTPPVYVYVSLNDYSYVKLEDVNYASGYIYGSFQAPNVATPGTVLKLTLKYEDGSTPVKTGTADIALTIVEGKGALVTGLTSDQAATLARIDTNLGTVLVRLSELNATIVDIKDGVATLNTKFGTMSAKLDAINATVADVKGEVVLVKTAIGEIKVKLEALNATIVAVEGDVALIKTDVGTIKTTLDAVNAKVVSIDGNVATIKTDVGTIKTDVETIKPTIADIKNGVAIIETCLDKVNATLSSIGAKIDSVSGNIATISTTVGTVKTTLDAVNAKVVSIDGNVATIKTDVGTISGKVTTIDGNVATIRTDVGTVKMDISDLKSSVKDVKDTVGTVPGAVGGLVAPIWAAVILSLIAAIAAIYAVVTIHRKIAG